MTSHRPDAAHRPESVLPVAGALLIIVLTLIAYIPVLADGGFIWDDDDYPLHELHQQGVDGLRQLWVPGNTHQYYPAVYTTFWIENQLWGRDSDGDPVARGFHIANVLLHIANALLIWRLMRLLRVPGAWLIGAVFALHPVHVESVAWITERKNVLSGFFYLLSAWTYVRFDSFQAPAHTTDTPTRRWQWYAVAMACFVAALLSKSVTCSLPAALILAMVLVRAPLTWRRLWPLLPMFLIGFLAAMHTAQLERSTVGAAGAEFDLSFVERCLIATHALLFYPWKLLVPWPVMFVYPRWTIDASNTFSYWTVVAVIIVSAAVLVALVRGRRGPFVGLAFFAGTVFPALGFFNVYPHIYSFVADHFQYLASLGVLALVIGGLVGLLRRRNHRLAMAVVLLAPCMVLTWIQASTYTSAESVWRDTIAKNEHSWMPHNNLSSILLRRAERALGSDGHDMACRAATEAKLHARRAVDIKPDHYPAHSNLSEALRLLADCGDPSERASLLEASLRHQESALEYGRQWLFDYDGSTTAPFLAVTHMNLGRLYHLLQRYDEAANAYSESLRIRPDSDLSLQNLGAVGVHFFQQRQLERSEDIFEFMVSQRPDNIQSLEMLGRVREAQRDYRGADDAFRRGVQVLQDARSDQRPRAIVSFLTTAARFYSQCQDRDVRDPDRAIDLGRALVDVTNERDPSALLVLMSLYADAGRDAQAIDIADAAIRAARQSDDRDVESLIMQKRDECHARLKKQTAPSDRVGPTLPGG